MKNGFTPLLTLSVSLLLAGFPAATAHAQAPEPGFAVVFDGASGLVRANTDPSFSFSNRLTLEAWVYPQAAKCNTIISRGDGGSASDYIFQVGYDGVNCNSMKVSFWAAGAWDFSSSPVPLNTRNHV